MASPVTQQQRCSPATQGTANTPQGSGHQGQTRKTAQWSQFTVQKSTNAPDPGLPAIPTGRGDTGGSRAHNGQQGRNRWCGPLPVTGTQTLESPSPVLRLAALRESAEGTARGRDSRAPEGPRAPAGPRDWAPGFGLGIRARRAPGGRRTRRARAPQERPAPPPPIGRQPSPTANQLPVRRALPPPRPSLPLPQHLPPSL